MNYPAASCGVSNLMIIFVDPRFLREFEATGYVDALYRNVPPGR
jgi:hypothetical protein